jgi:hypothetical protein
LLVRVNPGLAQQRPEAFLFAAFLLASLAFLL